MHDASMRGSTEWIHQVLQTLSSRVPTGAPPDVQALARSLDQAPWWNGCPRAPMPPASAIQAAYRRVPLAQVDQAGYSALLIAWPPGYATPVHDHDGLWGIELVLDGVLKVEAFALAITPQLALYPRGTRVLGVGDHAAFSERDYAHRCRNLSAHQPALSLHVYGGKLSRYHAFNHDDDGHWRSAPQRVTQERALT